MSKIKEVLSMTYKIREAGGTFNPLFVGPPGVGKSQEIQQWCAENKLPFIDLRTAYLDAPDVKGFPEIHQVGDRRVMTFAIPEYLPEAVNQPKGVLLLEEPNRGTVSVMNTLMQLLTDRKIDKYTLPDGWIIVGAINPETSEYEVNTMDPALKNRFQIFTVDYHKPSFVAYMRKKSWHPDVINFVDSNAWEFVKPEQVSNSPGAKYVSPRSLEALNEVVKQQVGGNLEMECYTAILGTNYGAAFYQFRHNDSPVLLKDLLGKGKKKALEKLKRHCDPNNYKNGHISVTVKDLLDNSDEKTKEGGFVVSDELLTEALLVIPADQGVVLVRDIEYKRNDTTGNNTLSHRLVNGNSTLKDYLKDVLKGGVGKNVSKE